MKTTGDLIGQNSASNGRRIANLPKFDEGYRVSNHKLTKKGDISQVSRIKMRQALFNQFSRILKSTEDATNLAEDTEKEIFEVSKNRLRYIHAIDSLICKTRQNPPNNYLDTIINHKNTLRSSENNDIIHPTSNSVYRSKFGKYIWKMSVMELYIKLLDCVASFDELQDNGYPYKKFNCHSDDEILINETIYNWQLKRDLTLEEDEEICVRCHQRFIRVNSLDEVKDTDCCIYHPMNLTNKKYYGESNKLYRCCEQPSESPGCKTAVFHVFHQEIDLKSFTSLIQKPSNSSLQQQNTFGSSVAVADDLIIDETATIFALDCEMVYTVRGYELARVTLIDSMFHVVIDSLIKLTCDVVDYNSEFSGLTKSDIENATETLEDVRSKLNEILSKPKTPPIIVGHGLENDLISLGYHYNYIIDTALIESFSHNPYNNSENTKKNADSNPNNALKYVKMNNNNNNPTRDSSKSLFPNRHMKASLKKMAQIHLGKIIQADSSGHDSYEDACSALDIVYAIVMKKKQ
ncbi:MAG: RNA exonuclease 1 [Marteilia pararefringens]